jgi:FkbM family methyltransferase
MSSKIVDSPLSGTDTTESLAFVHQESAFAYGRDIIKSSLFRYLTKESVNLFLKGKDKLSVYPQAIGAYEPTISSLITYFSSVGNSDFLIDIGANIGLISCQSGNKFKRVDMFEPNPHCCKILEVNSAIAFDSVEYHIHNYGLGDEDKTSPLSVPRNNWGGAFIKDKTNSYDEAILASKDGFKSIIDTNYFNVDIEIRKTSVVLSKLFKELSEQDLSCGVVKIDVEGYELAILNGLAESLPSHLNLFVIFESWNSEFDIEQILKSFKGRATPYKLVREVPWKKTWPKVLKAASLFLHPKITHRVVTNRTQNWLGDIVLQIR